MPSIGGRPRCKCGRYYDIDEGCACGRQYEPPSYTKEQLEGIARRQGQAYADALERGEVALGHYLPLDHPARYLAPGEKYSWEHEQ